ncbi:MAG: radical SAM protein [Candidatus Handelsmanbacteria bacterium RIFCSPLOWO2_12_FULL_64_10]|uniref:Radical SAM protein n=1 Tax=Handelsmanbacteria sp. (strain RIFCSPLOWO2_12_FULL_64_10) TaxID=1817868 RepID=A0A1F6CT64_HANXR|nr:MAG: radical SAM protein [Candidatus Handelsmanbacteria bacterium RIFCSPLOWO2_12_FULL_64_10]
MNNSDTTPDAATIIRAAQARHPRLYEENRYVYPVLSRRSKGISVGVNLNPDKVCNFDCIYCQVDRTVPPVYREVDLDLLEEEVRRVLGWERDGLLYERPPFAGLPAALRRVNDVAFSGDGEPTSCPQFRGAAERVIRVREEMGLGEVKVVVITNATLFHRPRVREALALLDRHSGEVWAKLDAGTEAYYRLIERTTIPFSRVVRNLVEAAQARPLVIQSLFMKVHGAGPDEAEIDAYCGVLRRILDAGGGLKLIQVYTVARRPAEGYVTPLNDAEVDRIGDRVRETVGAPVEVYYGIE